MQAACPQCQTRIQIDDAKVPDRPFSVKCPKCQAVVKLAGRGAAGAALPSPPADSGAPVFSDEALKVQAGAPPLAAQGDRALISFPDPGIAAAMAQTLSRLGYGVDTVATEDASRALDQGVFVVAATARAVAPGGRGETLYQRITRLSPDARRQVFIILAGDEFKTADGTQAWACLADLVVATRDVAQADNAVRMVMAERNRMYKVFLETKRRYEASFAAEA